MGDSANIPSHTEIINEMRQKSDHELMILLTSDIRLMAFKQIATMGAIWAIGERLENIEKLLKTQNTILASLLDRQR